MKSLQKSLCNFGSNTTYMGKRAFSLSKMVSSFRYATQGFRSLFQEEPNARVHLLAIFVVVLAGWYLQIEPWEWVSVLLCFGLVLSLEFLNTSIENIADLISAEQDSRIGKIKDLAAAAVLFSALMAFIVGLIIFIPKVTGLI